ncbi:MAG: asparagine synthetase [Micavibrio sp.]|nr:asparagine synthetase [Micavibrio sp.]
MCGIAGLYQPKKSQDERHTLALAMNNAIAHRGPDGDGLWGDETITLAHRRLSILDLSPAGAQPMASQGGDWVVSFNGEIYNHNDIRKDLSVNWRGHSDTETIAEGLQQWGFTATLAKMNGMFALAAYHRPSRELFIARDRMGEKPLYYAHYNGGLAFASELAALMQLPDLPRETDREAAAALLMHRYIPAPLCILKAVRKLPAAHYLHFGVGHAPTLHAYWQLPQAGITKMADKDISVELSSLLLSATKMRMLSDVPFGAFLSGGIDSSAIVAAMQRAASNPVQTYTIGFEDPRYNEAPIAAKVAKALGTRHTEFQIGEAELIALVPRMAKIYSEPFADFSQIPTIALSQNVRRDVTVALAGDGGDECFAGYSRIHETVGEFTGGGSPLYSTLAGIGSSIAPFALRKTNKRLAMKSQADFASYYNLRYATWHQYSGIVPASSFPEPFIYPDKDAMTAANKFEMLCYLPEDILTKVDRASMSASLEVRAPFLDHTLVEFLWQLPPAQRAQYQPKGLLRKFLSEQIPSLPAEIFTRPKQGFEPPLAAWLRGPLKGWADDLLNEPHPWLNMKLVRQYWHAMTEQNKSMHQFIWPVLMLRAWEREYGVQ